jgi:hypothetical protein
MRRKRTASYTFIVRKHEEMRKLGRCMRRWEHDIDVIHKY